MRPCQRPPRTRTRTRRWLASPLPPRPLDRSYRATMFDRSTAVTAMDAVFFILFGMVAGLSCCPVCSGWPTRCGEGWRARPARPDQGTQPLVEGWWLSRAARRRDWIDSSSSSGIMNTYLLRPVTKGLVGTVASAMRVPGAGCESPGGDLGDWIAARLALTADGVTHQLAAGWLAILGCLESDLSA